MLLMLVLDISAKTHSLDETYNVGITNSEMLASFATCYAWEEGIWLELGPLSKAEEVDELTLLDSYIKNSFFPMNEEILKKIM